MSTNPVAAAAALAAACAALAATPIAQASIVGNGDFESGDLAGWTAAGDLAFVGVAAGVGNGGSFGAYFGPDPSATLSQQLATVPGLTYVVRFSLALDDSATPNAFAWSWDGVERGREVDAAGHDFVTIEQLIKATSSTSTLQFEFSNPLSFFRLDDVLVAVPEPAPAALLAAALLALAALRRRVR